MTTRTPHVPDPFARRVRSPRRLTPPPVPRGRGQAAPVPTALAVEEDLDGLEVDGYRIEFSVRVALLPVDLAESSGTGVPS